MPRSSHDRRIEQEIAEILARPSVARVDPSDPPIESRDITERLLRDASFGPGEKPRLVASAKPARNLTPTLADVLRRLADSTDRSFGHVSKALAYSKVMPLGKRDHANLIRLIKGGYVHACEVLRAPPPGSGAHRDSPHASSYYVLHIGPCEGEGASTT